MTTRAPDLRAWLELSRISNVPTCLSNVLTGCAIGAATGPLDPWSVARTTIAVILLYVGGMALNDVADRATDRTTRPDRPIPSGRITIRAASLFATACLLAGAGILSLSGPPAAVAGLLLVGVIVAYDLVHGRTGASVVLMGACRGLVYVAAAAAVGWPPDGMALGVFAGAITTYVALLTWIARRETGPSPGRRLRLAFVLPVVALTPWIAYHPASWPLPLVAALVLVAWLAVAARQATARPPRVRNAVMGWLSGICLLDAFYLVLLGRPVAASLAAGCFVLTALGHRRILGT